MFFNNNKIFHNLTINQYANLTKTINHQVVPNTFIEYNFSLNFSLNLKILFQLAKTLYDRCLIMIYLFLFNSQLHYIT